MYAWFLEHQRVKDLRNEYHPQFRIYHNNYLFTVCRCYQNKTNYSTHYYRCRFRYTHTACKAKITIKWSPTNTIDLIICTGRHTPLCPTTNFVHPYSLLKYFITNNTIKNYSCNMNQTSIHDPTGNTKSIEYQPTNSFVDDGIQNVQTMIYETVEKDNTVAEHITINQMIYKKIVHKRFSHRYACTTAKCDAYCLIDNEFTTISLKKKHNHTAKSVQIPKNKNIIRIMDDANIIHSSYSKDIQINADIQYLPSIQNKEHILIYKKYLYCLNRKAITKNNPHIVHYFRCYETINKSKCNASITIHFQNRKQDDTNKPARIRMNDVHFCIKKYNYQQIVTQRYHLYKLKCALPGKTSIKNLYHEYINKVIFTGNQQIQLPSFHKIYKTLWFHQRKEKGKVPLSVQELEIAIDTNFNRCLNHDKWTHTVKNGNIVLSTTKSISRLANADFISIDGNHKSICYFGHHQYFHKQLVIIYAMYVICHICNKIYDKQDWSLYFLL